MAMFKDRRGKGKVVNLNPQGSDPWQKAKGSWKVEGTQIEKSQYNQEMNRRVDRAENPPPRRDKFDTNW
jgi:hypothetical protein